MGKTIVRRHLTTTDAHSVWRELNEHMKTSSKGASEKRRLTQYVTNTVLDDNFKETTEQCVLHFNEQFRQLDNISDDSEKLPPIVKLTPLQTAVRSINDLRIVEALEEFQVPPMAVDSLHPFHTKHTMISLSMLVLGMIRPKRLTLAKEGMSIIPILILLMLTTLQMSLIMFQTHLMEV